MMKHLICLIFAGITLSGCATVVRGSNQTMKIATEPPGALVTTDHETKRSIKARKKNPDRQVNYLGCASTPCEFEAPRKSEFILTISKPGYEDVEIGIDRGLSKKSLNANLTGAAVTGVGMGVMTGAALSAWTAAYGTSGMATSAVGGGLAVGAATLAGVGAVVVGVDVATGAIYNLRPNPIAIALPPAGTTFEPHPGVAIVREKRGEKSGESDK